MTLHVHAFMQNPNNSHTAGPRHIERNVGLILTAPQIRRQLCSTASELRLHREHFESFVKTKKVGARFLQPELANRVFVYSFEIGSGFGGEAINGHRPASGFRPPP